MTGQERISSIVQSGIQYNDLSSNMKMSVRQTNPYKELSIDAQLRIVKNEALQISFRIPVLGTEVVRILITPERIVFIDRMSKQYLSEPLQAIQSLMPFDFDYYNLEAIFTNQLFITGKKEINAEDYLDFQIKEDNFRAYLTHSDKNNILYNFESDNTHRIQTLRIESDTVSSFIQCDYTRWGLASNNGIFPMLLNMHAQTPDKVFDLICAHRTVNINTAFTIDYNIPNNYRKLTIQQAFRLLEQVQ
jgi:hypothetical protein